MLVLLFDEFLLDPKDISFATPLTKVNKEYVPSLKEYNIKESGTPFTEQTKFVFKCGKECIINKPFIEVMDELTEKIKED